LFFFTKNIAAESETHFRLQTMNFLSYPNVASLKAFGTFSFYLKSLFLCYNKTSKRMKILIVNYYNEDSRLQEQIINVHCFPQILGF